MEQDEEDEEVKAKRLREELDQYMADWNAQEGNLERAQVRR